MYNEWGKGILTLIRKKNEKVDINNYRPIVLLRAIYTIWATIIMNLLTNDSQCAYKKQIGARLNILGKKQNNAK